MISVDERFYAKLERALSEELSDVRQKINDTLKRYNDLIVREHELTNSLADVKRINQEFNEGKDDDN